MASSRRSSQAVLRPEQDILHFQVEQRIQEQLWRIHSELNKAHNASREAMEWQDWLLVLHGRKLGERHDLHASLLGIPVRRLDSYYRDCLQVRVKRRIPAERITNLHSVRLRILGRHKQMERSWIKLQAIHTVDDKRRLLFRRVAAPEGTHRQAGRIA